MQIRAIRLAARRGSKALTAIEREPSVVVVDDDPSVRRALSRLLLAHGLGVQTYPSAEDFLATSHPDDVACLVVDVQMGGMSGLELLERLSEAGDTPPSIVITAHDDVALRERVRQSGAFLLRKPFESTTVLGAIGAMIGRDLDPSRV
jgi:FixJ family two-component response regulator